MEKSRRQVVIVRASTENATPEEKDDCDILVESLVVDISSIGDPDQMGKQAAVVEVVDSIEEADHMLREHDILILITDYMSGEEERVVGLRTDVLTLMIVNNTPPGTVCVINRRWLADNLIRTVLLNR